MRQQGVQQSAVLQAAETVLRGSVVRGPVQCPTRLPDSCAVQSCRWPAGPAGPAGLNAAVRWLACWIVDLAWYGLRSSSRPCGAVTTSHSLPCQCMAQACIRSAMTYLACHLSDSCKTPAGQCHWP